MPAREGLFPGMPMVEGFYVGVHAPPTVSVVTDRKTVVTRYVGEEMTLTEQGEKCFAGSAASFLMVRGPVVGDPCHKGSKLYLAIVH